MKLLLTHIPTYNSAGYRSNEFQGLIVGRYDAIEVDSHYSVFALKYLHYRNKIKRESEVIGDRFQGRLYLIDYKKKSFLNLIKYLRRQEIVGKHFNSTKLSQYLKSLIQGDVNLNDPIIKKYHKELTQLLKARR